MTLHELATNAAKYGALSTEVGAVEVAWRQEPAAGGRALVLVWQERGGPEVRPPQRRSFGAELIERGIAYELGGTAQLEFAPRGSAASSRLPLEPGRHDQAEVPAHGRWSQSSADEALRA